MSILSSLLLSIGALAVSVNLYRLSRFIYIYNRSSSLGRYCHADGNKQAWALVTGGSQGIGRALVSELANRGFNVVVHGRNEKKLQGIIDELATEFPDRKFRIAVLDACLEGQKLIDGIRAVVEDLKDINLTVLINNVGGPPPAMKPVWNTFDRISAKDNDDMLSMNLRFPTQLTAALLPDLLKHQPSLIATIGSLTEEGSPYLTMYGGSKAFLMAWCKALAREMQAEGQDVEVLGIRTAEVTNTSSNSKPATWMMPDAKRYASALLDRVGCGQVLINGYWSQALVKAFADTVPDPVFASVLTQAMKREMAKEQKKV